MVAKRKRFNKGKEEIFQNIVLILLFFLIFFGITGLLFYNNIKISSKRGELGNQAQELQNKVVELEAQKKELEEGGFKIEDIEFQEEVLREKGLYKKPGEEVITILPIDDEDSLNQAEEGSNWWNPLNWFGDN